MKVGCPSCSTTLNIDEKKVPPTGARIRCPSCQNIFPVRPSAPAASAPPAVPLPGAGAAPPPLPPPLPKAAAPGSAVPLPGSGGGGFDLGSIPLPGAAGASAPSPFDSGSIPLPGGASAPTPFDSGSIPLPGASDGGFDAPSIPLPGGGGGGFDLGSIPLPGGAASASTATHDSIPLPGGGGFGGAVPLPGGDHDWENEPTRAVPRPNLIPGASMAAAPPSNIGLAADGRAITTEHSIPLPGGFDVGPDDATQGAIPLPGHGAALGGSEPIDTSPFGLLSSDQGRGVPLPGGAEIGSGEYTSPAAPSYPESALGTEDATQSALSFPPPAAAGPESFEVDLAPSDPNVATTLPPAPVSGPGDFSLDMDLPPPPPARVAHAPAFEDLPAPRGAALIPDLPPMPEATQPGTAPPQSFELEDLPSPAFGDLPSPAIPNLPTPAAAPAGGAPLSFGDIDLGGDSLEFDPSSAPKKDDFEADLSSPLPPPSRPGAPADGLEMLSFIDDAAKKEGAKPGGGKVARFHIRRRSGKTFGPFEQGVVLKMLEDGQLLGNEEVSTDGERWQPIGSEGAFQAAIAALMESPNRAATATAVPSGGDANPQNQASMERLKNLYEGRMAAVAVVQGKEPVPLKKRLPWIIAAAVVLLVVGTGLYLGTTPYGMFGLKVLLPATLKPGTREFADVNKAKQLLQADTFKGYTEAKTLTQGVLQVKEYPEARAVWVQTVFYLQRRHAAAQVADVQAATQALADIELLGKKHVEVAKAQAGSALAKKNPDEAQSVLADALARAENGGDVELLFLRAEAERLKGQNAPAKTDLEAILKQKPDLARAHHALGELAVAMKQTEEAKAAFEAALKADPEHASSAVELAALELLEAKQVDSAVAALDQALDPAKKEALGPAEVARALALKGEALALKHQDAEAIAQFEEAIKADARQPFARARLGQLYLNRKEYAKALPLLQEAATATPESFAASEALLSALIGVGQMQDARTVVTDAAKRFPTNARLAYLKGKVELALGKQKEAESAWQAAVAADAAMVEPRLGLAELYLQQRKVAEARAQVDAAAQQPGERADVLVARATLDLLAGKTDEADQATRRALELAPTMGDAHVARARVLTAKNDGAGAEAAAKKALELEPGVPHGQLVLGEALRLQQKFDLAAEALEKARLADPKNTQAAVLLGTVQREKGDFAGAAGTLLAAIQADPANAETHYQLGLVRIDRREFNSAVDSLKKALEYTPKVARYEFHLGRALQGAAKSAEAQAAWKHVLELDPKYVDAYEQLGRAALERNDFKAANGYLAQALALEPSRAEVQVAIGDAQAAQDDWASAGRSYEKALQLKPDLPGVRFKVGQAYGEQRRFSEAMGWYRRATAQDPKNAAAWLNLGWAAKEQKLKTEALEAFTKYLELKPDADNKKDIEDEIYFLKSEK